MRPRTTALAVLLLVAAIAAYDLGSDPRLASGPGRRVAASTFTTDCAGVSFRTDDDFVLPDQPSCVYYPNGTVWRGANKTDLFYFEKEKVNRTGNIKNAIYGGMQIDVLGMLPTKTPIVVLDGVGLRSLNTSLDGSLTARIANGVLALYLWNNQLTEINTTFNENLQELYLANNSISSLSIRSPSLISLDMRNNVLTDAAFALGRVNLPPSLSLLALDNNSLSAVPPLPPLVSAVALGYNNISSIASVAWPSTLRSLVLNDNKLTEVVSNFPPMLRILSFAGNRLTAFYANESQYELLSQVNESATIPGYDIPKLFTTLTNASCVGHKETRLLFGVYPICILPDTPSVLAATAAERVSWGLLTALLLLVIALTAAVAYTVLRRCHPPARKWYDDDAHFFAIADSTRLGYDVRFDHALQEFRIPVDDLERDIVLAKGGFGVVYKATLRRTTPVAMKRMLPAVLDSPQAIDEFMHEIRLYAQLQHPKVVQFIGMAWSTLANISMVTEFMPHGDAWALVEANKDVVTSWFEAMVAGGQATTAINSVSRRHTASSSTADASYVVTMPSSNDSSVHALPGASRFAIISDVVDAMVYLHSFPTPVIHRDIKARNVLLGPHYEAKLTDFGTSRLRVDDLTMTAEIGTSAWIAPEVLKGVRYTEKADIYSFGVLMAELDTAEVPYSNVYLEPGCTLALARARIAMLVATGDLVPTFTDACPSGIVAIAQRCLAHDPALRPTAAELALLLRQYHPEKHGSFDAVLEPCHESVEPRLDGV
ncbi:TKL protein kinase [Saprolegnia diclina VS20]|uniref:TKL protein kinase n=1 Tax=Saprolegnia diclina (strain VS20) TaxID=1156394 RepID=T0QVD5_SAPDV|nr:TKL protein kinase [Saprolegnia diclina VS20]EQC42184.1 TKL protein kinase [Saprolegnia diclina VS20]|eukprot:XP_008604753.1 TKL protein kinase [Saprolegnia diclina VS20]